jgi:molybdopterin-guanine dinucleotide biosynthesis protein A
MTAPEKVFGLVLAGGKSKRMGSDKALFLQDGRTQLSRAVSLLEAHLDRVFVSTRADQADDPERSKFAQVIDRYDDMGPVAGILSAMDSNDDVGWLVLACDLPNIDDATIAHLLEQCSAEHPVTAYESVRDGLPEPLCAIYLPDSRALILSFVNDGIICPRTMLINADTHLLAQPNPDALHNINSPEDLAGTGIESIS